MSTQAQAKSDFYRQLGRMYGTYTGSFIAFIIFVAILEQVGTPNRILGYLFVGFTIAVYAIIGVMTRTAQVSEYYVAGRRVRTLVSGEAHAGRFRVQWNESAALPPGAYFLALRLGEEARSIPWSKAATRR